MGLASMRFAPIDDLGPQFLPDLFRTRGASLGDWQDFLYLVVSYFLRANTAVGVPEDYLRWMGRPGRPRRVKSPDDEAARKMSEIPWPRVSSSARTTRVARLLSLGLGLNLDDPADLSEANECLRQAWTVLRRLNMAGAMDFQLDLRQARFTPLTRAWLCPVTRKLVDRCFRGITPNIPLTATTASDFTARPVDLPRLPFPWRRKDDLPVDPGRVRDWLASDPVVATARDLGVWTDLHDRIALVAPYMRAAEHSAQQPSQRLQVYERQFRAGEINVLNCSTTMEMGVDIGGIAAVMMTNVPPAPANYRQRVGRAGRRGESLSVGLTFCGDNALGWKAFRSPTWAFDQQIRPPQIALDSSVIVQRHVNALLLSEFLKSKSDAPGENLLKLPAGWFFIEGQRCSPCLEFISWCGAAAGLPKGVADQLDRLVAGTCLASHAELRHQTADAIAEIQKSWSAEYSGLADELKVLSPDDRGARQALTLQMSRMEKGYLLSELAARGFLPGHGFPTFVVPFVVIEQETADHDAQERAGNRSTLRSYPTRQLDMAIRDYAPGSEVVLDGLVYRSEGVTLNWHKPAGDENAKEIQSVGFAWRCDCCGSSDTSASRPSLCSQCGQPLPPANILPFLRPAGFTVDRRNKPHTDVATLSQIPPSPPWIAARGGHWVPLPDPGLGRFRSSREGHIFHYTRGRAGHGFASCLHCGRAAAENEAPGRQAPPLPDSLVNHYPLRGGSQRGQQGGYCEGGSRPFGVKRHVALGHNYATDVYELQLFGLADESVATSLVIALRETLARELGIESSELGWRTVVNADDRGGACRSLLLYDTAAGGAGFASNAAILTADLLARAADLLRCDCVAACHACLLSRDSQHHAHLLDRRAALAFLEGQVLPRLQLAAEHQVFGPATRPEYRRLSESLDQHMFAAPDATLRLFLFGPAAAWDLVEWPARSLLETWGRKGRTVELVAEAETIATLSSGQRLALTRLLERSRGHLLASKAPPKPEQVIASISSGCGHRLWAVTDPAAAVINESWGTSASGPVVLAHSDEPICADAQAVPLEHLLADRGDTASVLGILADFNGPIEEFGLKFWGAVLSCKPEIGQLVRSGPTTEVIYQDRYLFSPLMLRLLGEILRPLTSGGESTPLRIRTLSGRQTSSMGAPYRLWNDWSNNEHRRTVIEDFLSEIGFDTSIELGNLSTLPHDRSLTVRWPGGELVLHLDQGLGHWQSTRAVAFAFNASPAEQASELASLRFDVTNRSIFPTAIFVHEPQLTALAL